MRVPFFSLARNLPYHTDPRELEAYYADRRLMWWNVIWIGITNLGWGLAMGIIGPLIVTTLVKLGVKENIQMSIGMVNNMAVMFLVMLFSWMSDHTISRLGRRKPYFFISAPFIIGTMVAFPFFADLRFVWLLLAMLVLYNLAMDLKMSTFSLIMIDCMPRNILGRTNSIFGIVGGVTGFLVSWNAGRLIALGEWVPYVLGGAVMSLTTLCALLIKEPPVYHPRKESFKPWSTFKVAALDKRIFVLMAGVALVGGYGYSSQLYMWYWAPFTLGLTRDNVFKALSFAPLANVILCYPIGWVVDRFGGLKVIVVYFLLATSCFFLQMHVHDKSGLILLVLAQTVAFPLYAAADVMVFKSCPEQDVGSITSTNAFFRNGFGTVFQGGSGWIVYWMGSNYRFAFVLGQIVSVIGMALFLIHAWLMRKGPAPAQIAVDNGSGAPPEPLATAIVVPVEK